MGLVTPEPYKLGYLAYDHSHLAVGGESAQFLQAGLSHLPETFFASVCFSVNLQRLIGLLVGFDYAVVDLRAC